METDAQHQQHHADLGELPGEVDVGDEARRRRPDHDASQQVADERREFEARRAVAEHQGQPEAGGNRGDQADVVRHPAGILVTAWRGRAAQSRGRVRTPRLE